MFKTILVPTDGSELSDKVINAAIEFAKANGAKVIGLSVAEPYPFAPLAESTMTSDRAVYDDNMKKLAQQRVQKISDAARLANVPCETLVTQSYHPYEEIIGAAHKYNCDAIFMGSHGRKGWNRLFVGSETQRVLAHSTIPVLVLR